MISTVPPRRALLLNEFPELLDYARTAVRLHPRPGTPSGRSSNVGGPMLWPTGEPWPTCTAEHTIEVERLVLLSDAEAAERHAQLNERFEAMLARIADHLPESRLAQLRETHEQNMVANPPTAHEIRMTTGGGIFTEPVVMAPVVQFFRRDAPELPFPDGTELLQILWCPGEHLGKLGPQPIARWRTAAELDTAEEVFPELNHVAWDFWRITPCEVHPEPLAEFPPICNAGPNNRRTELFGILPTDLEQRLRERDEAQTDENDHYFRLVEAPGWKLGGWDISTPEPDHLRTCPCGASMRPLLHVADGEALDHWAPNAEPDFPWGDPTQWRDQEPTGVSIGRNGLYWILACATDPAHELTTDVY
ncbi:hypothetical protein KDK95_33285 [Actinospica sp. MGRD01-02]|uniref:DUF1963 domain-containing protein n=1 Tax=Actinospica acidithermotolerans TaxID=2828514 RepID=A0A941EIW4_9ACTN|nr:hypothetical protein [Actinospica acidithermotolerans]MBR7831228.1 hypothetical protein [Actinospica acidithermotolerans]